MKVFYSDKMVAKCASFSPSAGKPFKAVQSWLANGFDIEIVEPVPVTLDQIGLAHSKPFARDILACRRENGFGNKNRGVVNSLPYTSGAMLDAAREAISCGGFACAPVSGFHHACWDSVGGYCTFNGLMIAAMSLLREGLVQRVGILDCDQHYGNGTEDIIDSLRLRAVVRHLTYGGRARDPGVFLGNLGASVREFVDCDVLLYQAGADPHIDDPLGGFLTTEQLSLRDRIVFEACRDMDLPCAFNLAGGYQKCENGTIRPVLDIHDNTMRECLSFC